MKMKKCLSCIVILFAAALAAIHASAAEGLLYEQDFEDFIASDNGSTAPAGLSCLNVQAAPQGSGIYSENTADGKCAVIKSSAQMGGAALQYNFKNDEENTFYFKNDLMTDNLSSSRSIYISDGARTAELFKIDTNGRAYAGNSKILGFKWQNKIWYNVCVFYSPKNAAVTVIIKSGDDLWKGQSSAEISDGGNRVKSIGLSVDNACEAKLFADNMKITECFEPEKIIYYDNFNYFSESDLSSARWITNGLTVTPSSGGNVMVTRTAGGDANIETYAGKTSGEHYDGDDDIVYTLSIKLADFNCRRDITVRDSAASYRYARSLGYIDTDGKLYWNKKDTDLALVQSKWYDLQLVYNRVSGKAELSVGDGQKKYNFSAAAALSLDRVSRIGIELDAMSTGESVMYIDNAGVSVAKPSTGTAWNVSGLKASDSLAGFNTNGEEFVKDNNKYLKLAEGEYISAENELTDCSNVFRADFYALRAFDAAVWRDDVKAVTFTRDFDILIGNERISKYCPLKTYSVGFSYNVAKQCVYTFVIEEHGTLLGYKKQDLSSNVNSVKIENTGGAAYLHSMGFCKSGNTLLPINIFPKFGSEENTSICEMVFPTFIDPASVSIKVNSRSILPDIIGKKSVGFSGIEPKSFYRVCADGQDLYGNDIHCETEFLSGNGIVDIKFENPLKTGYNLLSAELK